jgi:dUTP pyrophosphatase
MKFEKVSKYADTDIKMPERKTQFSAGYDMVAAEDYIIPPLCEGLEKMELADEIKSYTLVDMLFGKKSLEPKVYTLDEMNLLTKGAGARPMLVSTGMKCQLDSGYYLELSMRSSSPLKYLLVMANGVGIVDADYYNNPDNEGEIFFQILNLSPFPIKIQKGEAIGQGIIKRYHLAESNTSTNKRKGGFGSTDK